MTRETAKLFLKDFAVVCGVSYRHDCVVFARWFRSLTQVGFFLFFSDAKAEALLDDVGAKAIVRKTQFRQLFKQAAEEADADLTQSLVDHVQSATNDDDDDNDDDNDDDDDDDDENASSSVKMPAPAALVEPTTKPPPLPTANGWYFTVSVNC